MAEVILEAWPWMAMVLEVTACDCFAVQLRLAQKTLRISQSS